MAARTRAGLGSKQAGQRSTQAVLQGSTQVGAGNRQAEVGSKPAGAETLHLTWFGLVPGIVTGTAPWNLHQPVPELEIGIDLGSCQLVPVLGLVPWPVSAFLRAWMWSGS